MGGAPRRYPSERFPHKPHVPAKLAGARVVLFTPRKRRECSENIVLYVCFWHTASCLSPSYIGCEHFCIQYSSISFSWLQGMKQFQSLFLEPGVVILYSTTEYDHMGAFRCVNACTPLLLLFILLRRISDMLII